jgi:hypothetical protein
VFLVLFMSVLLNHIGLLVSCRVRGQVVHEDPRCRSRRGSREKWERSCPLSRGGLGIGARIKGVWSIPLFSLHKTEWVAVGYVNVHGCSVCGLYLNLVFCI